MIDHFNSPMAWLWDHFVCKKCGRCCTQLGLPWDALRLDEIGKFLGITGDETVERYYGKIVIENGEKLIEFEDAKRTPCPFLLEDHTCQIYQVRPDGCRAFPVETDFGRQGVDCPGLKIPA